MPQEQVVPIIWEEGWDQQDILVLTFYGVEFTRSFGIFNKGDKFRSIDVDYGKGIVEAYNEDGTEIVKTQVFLGAPVVDDTPIN